MAKFYSYDGACHELPDGVDMPDGAVVIDRLPTSGEYISENGLIVYSPALKIDSEFSKDYLNRIHAIKAFEAAVIMSGVELSYGLLVEESKSLNIPLLTLAEIVYAKSENERNAEVSRRMHKTSGN